MYISSFIPGDFKMAATKVNLMYLGPLLTVSI